MIKAVLLMTLAPIVLFSAVMPSTQAEQKAGASMQGMPQGMMGCPMKLEGTTIAVTDTPNGIEVSITTKPEDVAALQRSAERMAAMHSGESSSPAMMQGEMMPGTVKYEAIPDGAKLTLTPRDASKLAEFRVQVRAHVEKMQKGECSMMQDMMQGMMKGMMGGTAKEPKPETEKEEGDHSTHHPEENKSR